MICEHRSAVTTLRDWFPFFFLFYLPRTFLFHVIICRPIFVTVFLALCCRALFRIPRC